LSEKIQWVFEWIDLPVLKRPSLISLYIPDIDHSGHLAGPDSDLVNSTLSDVDYHIGLLLDGIEERHIKEETSIIIVSDHGMTKTSIEKVVFLDDFVPLNDYTFLENGPIFYIYPKQDDCKCQLM
jgi:predicted AlkP superfamily pyrophosphatase or phosphodiesterase